jgi:hypothetical protein
MTDPLSSNPKLCPRCGRNEIGENGFIPHKIGCDHETALPLLAEIERLRAALSEINKRADLDKYPSALRNIAGNALLGYSLEAAPPAETEAAPSPFDMGPTTSAWEHTHGSGEIACHSRVVKGVLCRWWGEGPAPEGVALIDRAAVNGPEGTSS